MAHSLIIGGTKGLGRVVMRRMAERGDRISVFGRSPVLEGDLLAGQINSYQIDITNPLAVNDAINKCTSNHGLINYCVFLQRYRGKDDDWAGEIETTLTATKNIIETVTHHLDPTGDKAMVMVSSVFSKYVGEGQSASYHVAKAGLDQLMRFYALNLGSKGVRCNGVTPFTFLKEESKKFYLDNKDLINMYQEIIPLKRMATAEDSANVVTYLCSEQSAFITGQNIVVDGGLSLVWPESLARRLLKI